MLAPRVACRIACAVLACGVVLGCKRERATPAEPSPPALPTTTAAAEALVAAETRRPIVAARELDAARVVRAADEHPEAIVAGEAAIARWIEGALGPADRDAFVLFGGWHDAPGQIDAFRHLVGPGGARGLTLVAVELLRADGAWSGAPAEAQRGDGADLSAFLATGDRDAFARLAASHREADYVAWKLGFEPVALDLLTTARATGVPLRGCDMPAALQERSGLPPGELRHRLREIHCARSLPPAPRHVAMLWGDAHVAPEGLPRFLPAAAKVLVVHLVGRRLEPGALEVALAKELLVAEPALVPLDADEAALVLPDATLGAVVDRALTTAEPGIALEPGLRVTSPFKASVSVAGRRAEVSASGTSLAVPPGDHAYLLAGAGPRVVGALRIAPGHRVELALEGTGQVTYVDRGPR
jgi:hypothetical protein